MRTNCIIVDISIYLLEDGISVKDPEEVTKPKAMAWSMRITICITVLVMVTMIAHPLYWISLYIYLINVTLSYICSQTLKVLVTHRYYFIFLT